MRIDPRQPTPALAGSPEKVRIMKARARLELPLFNPQDATGAVWRSPALEDFMARWTLRADFAARHERWRKRHRDYQRRESRERKEAARG
jgi:hypothetical protein